MAELPGADVSEPRADSALVSPFVAGDIDAFERVVDLYSTRVAGLVFRLLGYRGGEDVVDDLVQEVFLAALEQRQSFRGDSGIWTWLMSITLNRCRRYGRRQRVRKAALRWLGRMPADADAADATAMADESAQRVRSAIMALGDRDREVIVLHYFEQLPIAEICKLLGERPSAVAVRLHRAREKLRTLLDKSIS